MVRAMDETVTIRLAGAADAAALTQLYRDFLDSQFALDAFAERNPAFDAAAWVERRLRGSDVRVHVAAEGAALVGFCDCSVRGGAGAASRLSFAGVRPFLRSLRARLGRGSTDSYMAPRRVGYIHNTFVAPTHRGAGVGGRLVESCLTDMRGAGADAIYVNTLAANGEAQQLFGAHGFAPESLLLRWREGQTWKPGE